MHIVLFIGHHKVGSTSLQSYLALNHDRLLKQGVLYPTIMPADPVLDFKVWAARRLGIGPVPLLVREGHNALAHRLMYKQTPERVPSWYQSAPDADVAFDRIRQQIERHSPKTLVLCAESFSAMGAGSGDAMSRLADFCDGHDVQVQCTLRRPDEYVMSWHLQCLKFGLPMEPLRKDGLEGFYSDIHFDYAHMLRPWADTFGAAQVILSNYAETQKLGGSIPNFWQRSGMTEPKGLRAVPRTNPSIARAAGEIVRRANHDLSDELRQSFWRWMVEHNAVFDPEENKNIEMFGDANRQAMFERFASVHTYISDLAEHDPFFPDLKKMLNAAPVTDVEAAARILPAVQKHARKTGQDRQVLRFLDAVSL